MRFGLTAERIVGKGDCRRVVRIDHVCQIAPVVVGVVGRYAASPCAARELAVGGVGVGWAVTIGIDLVGHCAGGDVIEPSGDIARIGAKRLVTIGRHRGLVAKNVVGVANWVCRAAFVCFVATEVVFVDGGVTERIGDRGEITELVVSVSGSIAERVDRGGTLSKGIVFRVASVAATVGMGNLATKGIVCDSVSNGGNGDIHQRYAVTRYCKRFVGRVGERLAGGNGRRICQRLIFGHVTANIGCPRT